MEPQEEILPSPKPEPGGVVTPRTHRDHGQKHRVPHLLWVTSHWEVRNTKLCMLFLCGGHMHISFLKPDYPTSPSILRQCTTDILSQGVIFLMGQSCVLEFASQPLSTALLLYLWPHSLQMLTKRPLVESPCSRALVLGHKSEISRSWWFLFFVLEGGVFRNKKD